MALLPNLLSDGLLEQWLVEDQSAFPDTPLESGRRLAAAVAAWFATATAGPFPCATALARESQLASQAAAALQAGLPPAAGFQLGTAVSAYMTGQSFGAGTASAPLAAPAVATAFAAVFSDLKQDREDRALKIAAGCHLMALSTMVVFPAPMTPLPVM